MDFHPLTLVALSYMEDWEHGGTDALFRKVSKEILEIYQTDA